MDKYRLERIAHPWNRPCLQSSGKKCSTESDKSLQTAMQKAKKEILEISEFRIGMLKVSKHHKENYL